MTKHHVGKEITSSQAKRLGIKNPLSKEKLKISYVNVPQDKDRWVDAKKFLPTSFDLCYLQFEGGKRLIGWWADTNWMGLNIRSEDKVLYWKRKDHPTTL